MLKMGMKKEWKRSDQGLGRRWRNGAWSILWLLVGCLAGWPNASAQFIPRPTDPTAGDSGLEPSKSDPLAPRQTAYQITENGSDHRIWQRVETRIDETGQETEIVHEYTELASGLNYWDEATGDWAESRAQVVPSAEGGAVALQGQTKVIFSSVLGDPAGTVDVLAADGERFRAVVLGLAYYDPITGEDVIISEINPNAVGEIVGANQVIYRNAFVDIQADVHYEYRRDGLSQNVILREQPVLSPAALGMGPESQLQVLSEFLEAPNPVKEVRTIRPLVDGVDRLTAVEPDLTDESLDFGEIRMDTGTAFDLDDELGTRTIVTKHWEEVEGRRILFEGVHYETAAQQLRELPLLPGEGKEARLKSERSRGLRRQIPTRVMARMDPQKTKRSMQVAAVSALQAPGYLVDYELVSGSLTNYTFERGKTYHVTGSTDLYGTTIFEGGAVIKNSGQFFEVHAPSEFRTGIYDPLIITSMHDDTVGEEITGSTGTPPARANTVGWFLTFKNVNGQVVKNVRIKHGYSAYYLIDCTNFEFQNVQTIGCLGAFASFQSSGVTIGNALIDDVQIFNGTNTGCVASNVTFHDVGQIGFSGNPDNPELKNCLIVNVGSAHYVGDTEPHNVELASASGVFQSAGGGHFYLANSSPYRDLGTATIDPDLEADLEAMTTEPPTVLSDPHSLTTNTVWQPHVARDDNGTLDVGYHYPALDYLFREVMVESNVSLAIEAGTALGQMGAGFGLKFREGTQLTMNGTDTERIAYARYDRVQESVSGLSESHSHFLKQFFSNTSGTPNQMIIRGTDFYSGFGSDQFLNQVSIFFGEMATLTMVGNRFYGGYFYVYDEPGNHHTLVNNLFSHTKVSLTGKSDFEFRNNLLLDTEVYFDQASGTDSWEVQDNVFDSASQGFPGTVSLGSFDHNAYVDTSFRVDQSTLSNDVVLTSLAYESGPFGDYYQPSGSTLIDVGSRLSDAAGLLHHTVLATGPPEGDASLVTTVDIGLHYPAVDTLGETLLDSDWDGIPNILEDVNGNGLTEGTESTWKASDLPGVSGSSAVLFFNRTGTGL